MASPTKALKKVRGCSTKRSTATDQHFQQYKPTYEKLLREMKTLGGDGAMKELREWMVKEVHRTGHSPNPDAVRKQARETCSKRGQTISDDSPLRDGEK